MKEKHTPGPWEVKPEEADRDYLRVRGTRLGLRYRVANVLDVVYEDAPGREAEETQANARLIAAAPEMLETLGDALGALEDALPDVRRAGLPTRSGEEVIRKLRSVILKATAPPRRI